VFWFAVLPPVFQNSTLPPSLLPPFSFQVFWYAVLPPIILQQAYSLRKADFFQNLLPILVFGIAGTLLTFLLLTLASFYFSRLEWVLSAGCSDGLIDFRGGREGGREDGRGEEGTCFEDFSLIKSFLLAAILSASDGVAALKHIQPHHHSHQEQQQHKQQQQQRREGEGEAVVVHEDSSSSSSSSRLGAVILGENVLNEVGCPHSGMVAGWLGGGVCLIFSLLLVYPFLSLLPFFPFGERDG
jgi:hypothetical protein